MAELGLWAKNFRCPPLTERYVSRAAKDRALWENCGTNFTFLCIGGFRERCAICGGGGGANVHFSALRRSRPPA